MSCLSIRSLEMTAKAVMYVMVEKIARNLVVAAAVLCGGYRTLSFIL